MDVGGHGIRLVRSLMPNMTLWIPETDSVPYSQPKGTYYLNYWSTSNFLYTDHVLTFM